MRSFSFLTAPLLSAALISSLAYAEPNLTLLKAAGFVLTNREDFVRGRKDQVVVTSDSAGFIFQTDDPCIFQFRSNKGPQHEVTQVNFSKIKTANIEIPAYAHFPMLRLEGDKGLWCRARLSDTLVEDPTFLLTAESDCSDYVDMRYDALELVRLRDAVVFVNRNYCGYAGKPY